VLILIFGPGWVALDAFIVRRFRSGWSRLEHSASSTRLDAA
jgi:hypothetical protein